LHYIAKFICVCVCVCVEMQQCSNVRNNIIKFFARIQLPFSYRLSSIAIVINRIWFVIPSTNKPSFIPAEVFRASHNKIFEDLFNKRTTKLQRPRHRHAIINGRKVPREKRSPRRSLFRYHEHARSLGNFREVLPEVLRGGATFLILREDRIVLVVAPPRKIENRR